MSKKISQIALLAAMAVSAGVLVSAAPETAQAGAKGCKQHVTNKSNFCNRRIIRQRGYQPPRTARRMNFGSSVQDLPGRRFGADGSAGAGSEGGGGGQRSDIRLKRDIEAIGTLANGLTLYKFKYLWSDTDMVGVMAQEVLNVVPEAVITGEDGFYRVNYDKLGISMMTFDEWKTLVAELDQLPRAA